MKFSHPSHNKAQHVAPSVLNLQTAARFSGPSARRSATEARISTDHVFYN